jgi:protein involved in polysaccharide export with SLBB domain
LHGQVNSASAVAFVPGKRADWYLRRAGGVTSFGDKKAIFIVRSDGSVIGRGSESGWWGGNVLSTKLRPGDTVVVPEKIINPSPFWRTLLNTAQVSSSLAIAAAAIAK